MEWLVAIMIAAPVYFAVPYLISRSKRRRRRRTGAAFGHALDAGFSVFDPAKARAVQIVEVHKEIGHTAQGNQGEKHDDGKDEGLLP